MKKYFALLLAALLIFSVLPVQAAPAEAQPSAQATPTPVPTPKPEAKSDILAQLEPAKCKAAILMDAQSGEVLYALNQDEHNYPASITKVMTALLTLEAVDRGELTLETPITASNTFGYDLESGGSTQNIQAGETMSVLDLLYCVLVPSANEACNILAETISGDVPSFVDAMNARAQELGMKNTHFANAHGLHNANHYTSAYDVALMTSQALKNDTFITIVSSRSHVVPETNLHKERKLSSTNALINPIYGGGYTYPKAIGVKTGTTSAAGKCLVSAAVNRGEALICVVLGAEELKDEAGTITDRQQFSESRRLLKWGFDSFARKSLFDEKRPVREVAVELSADTTAVALKPQEPMEAMLPTDLDPADFQQDVTVYQDPVEAPIEAGQILGEMTVRNGDKTYGTVKLVAAASAQRSEFLWTLKRAGDFFSQLWVRVALVALAVLIVALILRFGAFKPRKGYYRRRKR